MVRKATVFDESHAKIIETGRERDRPNHRYTRPQPDI
jgi:hypothetical protein